MLYETKHSRTAPEAQQKNAPRRETARFEVAFRFGTIYKRRKFCYIKSDSNQGRIFMNDYQAKFVTPEQAVKAVQSGDWVDYGFGAGFPELLDKALAARKGEVEDV